MRHREDDDGERQNRRADQLPLRRAVSGCALALDGVLVGAFDLGAARDEPGVFEETDEHVRVGDAGDVVQLGDGGIGVGVDFAAEEAVRADEDGFDVCLRRRVLGAGERDDERLRADAVARPLDCRCELPDADCACVVFDEGLAGGVVHARGADAGLSAELLLDPHGARRAFHPLDGKRYAGRALGFRGRQGLNSGFHDMLRWCPITTPGRT